MKKDRLFVFELSSILLTAISVFFPFLLVSFLEATVSISLIYNNNHLGDGLFVLILCAAALISSYFRKHIPIIVTGILNLILFISKAYDLSNLYSGYNNALASAIAKSMVTKGLGYYSLLIGSILMIASGIYAISKSKRMQIPLSNFHNTIFNGDSKYNPIAIDKEESEENQIAHSNTNERITLNDGNDKVATLIKRIKIFIDDGDFKSADMYCEKVLDIDPENGDCYKYKLLIENGVKNTEELKQFILNGGKLNRKLLDRAVKYGSKDLTIFKFIDYKSDLWSKITDELYPPIDLELILSLNSTDECEIKKTLDEYTKEIIYKYNSSLPYTTSKISNLCVIKDYNDTQTILDKWYEDIKNIPNVNNATHDDNFELKKALIASFANIKNVKNDLESINLAETDFKDEKARLKSARNKLFQERIKRILPILLSIIAIVIVIGIIIIILQIYRSNASKVSFEQVGNSKKYKLEDGSYAIGWHEIKGNQYYFDSSGSLKTNTWIDDNDAHYVDEEGKMKKNYWLNYQNKLYYLGNDGIPYKNGIYTINGRKLSFSKNGILETNQVVTNPIDSTLRIADENGFIVEKEQLYKLNGKEYCIGLDGVLAQNEWVSINGLDKYYDNTGANIINGFAIAQGYTKASPSNLKKWCFIDNNGVIIKNDWIDCKTIPPNFENKWCYANKDGILLQNEWFSYKGNDYYFDDDCYMVTNNFVNGAYYVDEDGKKVKGTQKIISGKTYIFDANGITNLKTENDKWKISFYTDTNGKYVINRNYFSAKTWTQDNPDNVSLVRSALIVDKSNIRIRIKYPKEKDYINNYTNVKITIWNTTTNLYHTPKQEAIGRLENSYLVLSPNQQSALLNHLKTDGNEIIIAIVDYDEDGANGKVYNFTIDSTGFNEIYSCL